MGIPPEPRPPESIQNLQIWTQIQNLSTRPILHSNANLSFYCLERLLVTRQWCAALQRNSLLHMKSNILWVDESWRSISIKAWQNEVLGMAIPRWRKKKYRFQSGDSDDEMNYIVRHYYSDNPKTAESAGILHFPSMKMFLRFISASCKIIHVRYIPYNSEIGPLRVYSLSVQISGHFVLVSKCIWYWRNTILHSWNEDAL